MSDYTDMVINGDISDDGEFIGDVTPLCLACFCPVTINKQGQQYCKTCDYIKEY